MTTQSSEPVQIRANTVLPARREPFTLPTADGLDLVAELALPADREPVATLICLHPLPTHGGMMDSHLYRKAAFRLPALAGLAVLRFNTRGDGQRAGRSAGTFDEGEAERLDVEAAVADGGAPRASGPWLLGWSFGTELALRFGSARRRDRRDPDLRPRSNGPTSPTSDTWRGRRANRWSALVPELDDYLRPEEARPAIRRSTRRARSSTSRRPSTSSSARPNPSWTRSWPGLVPDSAPLPRTWDGPYRRPRTVTTVPG